MKKFSRFLILELDNLVSVMRRVEVAKYLEHNVEALQSSLRINQLQRNSFQWFHEGTLIPTGDIAPVQPLRQNFLTELTSCVAQLTALGEEAASGGAQQVKYREAHAAVEQRLRWACGANPDLQEVFDAFTTSFVSEMESLRKLAGIAKSVCGGAGSVLRHEALRTAQQTREAMAADSAFMALLGDCQQSAALKDSHGLAAAALTEQELGLFALSPPPAAGDVLDSRWIRRTEEAISERVREARERLRREEARCRDLVPRVQRCGRDLVSAVTEHQKLMADAGALLRTISKSEDYDIPEVGAFLQRYRVFSDAVSQVVKAARQEEQTEAAVREASASAARIKEMVPTIYSDVIDFSQLFKDQENLEAFKVKKEEDQIRKEDERKDKGRGGGKSAPTSEERNAFALNVLRRVRFKLEGREPDALKRASVQEQVDFVIREATGVDNLALMYEGWTAWI